MTLQKSFRCIPLYLGGTHMKLGINTTRHKWCGNNILHYESCKFLKLLYILVPATDLGVQHVTLKLKFLMIIHGIKA